LYLLLEESDAVSPVGGEGSGWSISRSNDEVERVTRMGGLDALVSL
jgi:hypothetical protein